MPTGVYIGDSNNKSRKVSKMYIGINNKSRKVLKGYIGVGGKSRLFFTSEKNNAERVEFLQNYQNFTLFKDKLYVREGSRWKSSYIDKDSKWYTINEDLTTEILNTTPSEYMYRNGICHTKDYIVFENMLFYKHHDGPGVAEHWDEYTNVLGYMTEDGTITNTTLETGLKHEHIHRHMISFNNDAYFCGGRYDLAKSERSDTNVKGYTHITNDLVITSHKGSDIFFMYRSQETVFNDHIFNVGGCYNTGTATSDPFEDKYYCYKALGSLNTDGTRDFYNKNFLSYGMASGFGFTHTKDFMAIVGGFGTNHSDGWHYYKSLTEWTKIQIINPDYTKKNISFPNNETMGKSTNYSPCAFGFDDIIAITGGLYHEETGEYDEDDDPIYRTVYRGMYILNSDLTIRKITDVVNEMYSYNHSDKNQILGEYSVLCTYSKVGNTNYSGLSFYRAID